MRGLTEIRWHARGGQGAKTASQLFATAMLRHGKYVQAFPEYGPERRGAPLRAFTRVGERPIRRHDAVITPDVVVVLEPSLVDDPAVTDGLAEDGLLLVNADAPVEGALSIPASRLAPRSVNLVMVGALAAALGEPSPEELAESAIELLGRKVDPDAVRQSIRAGFDAARKDARCAA
jgi:pyruvate ferredoxin oxidoreductase gamma subunit